MLRWNAVSDMGEDLTYPPQGPYPPQGGPYPAQGSYPAPGSYPAQTSAPGSYPAQRPYPPSAGFAPSPPPMPVAPPPVAGPVYGGQECRGPRYSQQGYGQPVYGQPTPPVAAFAPPPAMPSRPVAPPPIAAPMPVTAPGAPLIQSPQWTPAAPGFRPPAKKSGNMNVGLALGVVAVLLLSGIGYASSAMHRVSRHAHIGAGSRSLRRTDTPTTPTSGSTGNGDSTGSTTSGGGATGPLTLADNPLFGAGLGPKPVTCRLPAFQPVETSSRAFITALLPCLEAAWNPVLAAAKLPTKAPRLAFPAGREWSSPCGGTASAANAAAFYCGVDDTLYMPFEGLEGKDGSDEWDILVFAHEYGHHVQHQAGVMSAYENARYDKGDSNSPSGLELSRRLELQAECFAGLFYAAAADRGSVTRQQAETAFHSDSHTGDDKSNQSKPDHGTGARIEGWARQGMQQKTTAGCNTWAASATDVS